MTMLMIMKITIKWTEKDWGSSKVSRGLGCIRTLHGTASPRQLSVDLLNYC